MNTVSLQTRQRYCNTLTRHNKRSEAILSFNKQRTISYSIIQLFSYSVIQLFNIPVIQKKITYN